MRSMVWCVCAALAFGGCSHQQQTAENSAPATQPPAPLPAHAYNRADFVGTWTCDVTNGQISVVTTSTMRGDGTAIGRGTAYGHTTPAFESSWSYAPSGPTAGTLRTDNMRFPPPHYVATAAVTWDTHDHFAMHTVSDTNPGGIGSKMDCKRAGGS